MSTTILAIGLGKFNSVLCWYDPAPRDARLRTVATTPDDPRHGRARPPVARAVFEACPQAGWAHDRCERLGLTATAAHTTGTARRWKRVRRKTDRDGVLRLARLAAGGGVKGVPVPPRAVRQWTSLIGLRKRLVSERTRGQNRIRGLLAGQGMSAPCGAKAWAELGLAGIGQLARPLSDCAPGELWRGEPQLLLERARSLAARLAVAEARLDALAERGSRVSRPEAVPGVCTRAAEAIAAHPHDARRLCGADEVSV